MRGFLLLIILGSLFCAAWFGAATLLRMAPGQLSARDVQVQSVAVTGFPLLFDIAVERPALPARGWSAEALRLSLPSYWPFSATGTLSGPQELTWRGAAWRIDGPDMPLSITLTPGMVVTTATLEGRDLSLRGPIFGHVASMAVSLSPAETPTARALALDLDGLSLGGIAMTAASLRAVLDMTAPPRLTDHPSLTRINLNDARITMREIEAEATGTLDRNPDDKRLTGELRLTITNWRALFGLMQNAGLIPPGQAPMLLMMAQRLGTGDTLSLPVSVRSSVVYLGPLALLDLGPV